MSHRRREPKREINFVNKLSFFFFFALLRSATCAVLHVSCAACAVVFVTLNACMLIQINVHA